SEAANVPERRFRQRPDLPSPDRRDADRDRVPMAVVIADDERRPRRGQRIQALDLEPTPPGDSRPGDGHRRPVHVAGLLQGSGVLLDPALRRPGHPESERPGGAGRGPARWDAGPRLRHSSASGYLPLSVTFDLPLRTVSVPVAVTASKLVVSPIRVLL